MGEAIEKRGGHFGVAEDGGPFADAQGGGDDDAGSFVELAQPMEEQRATRGAEGQVAVTPDDGAILDPMPRALFVGTGGAVALEDRTGSVVVWTVGDGPFLPVAPMRVQATGTTASRLVTLW